MTEASRSLDFPTAVWRGSKYSTPERRKFIRDAMVIARWCLMVSKYAGDTRVSWRRRLALEWRPVTPRRCRRCLTRPWADVGGRILEHGCDANLAAEERALKRRLAAARTALTAYRNKQTRRRAAGQPYDPRRLEQEFQARIKVARKRLADCHMRSYR